ncbi:quinone oxidoreductase family protein [Rubrobacter radiotolerans]
MQAVRVERTGGPEVLDVQQVAVPEPGPGELLVKVSATGVNYIETYQREGIYPMDLPYTPGSEGAGEVVALGEGVTEFSEGDYVATAAGKGFYAEYAIVPAEAAVEVNVTLVEARIAAAAMLQGMTAHYLTHSTFPLKEGHTMLIHAAAGGVGLLVCQMAKMLGARVIGTAGSEEKAELAKGAGADEVILYREVDFAEEVRRLTDGEGVDVVYDSVGKDTFYKSLDCLKVRGTLVLFGASSGPVPPVDLQILNQKGGLYVTRPALGQYTRDREELLWRAGNVLSWIGNGTLDVRIGGTYPLSEARAAHEDLQGRRTTGKLLLLPEVN